MLDSRTQSRGRLVAYCRVSSDEQSDNVSQQRAEIERWAERRGEVIEVWYEDAGVSGTKRSRPAWDRLRADAKAGKFDRIVALNDSRYGRWRPAVRIEQFNLFAAAGVEMWTTSGQIDLTSDIGAIIQAAAGLGPAAEVREKSQRVLGAAIERAQAGWWGSGWAPDGLIKIVVNAETGEQIGEPYRHGEVGPKLGNGRRIDLIVDPERAPIVRRMFKLYGSGKFSLESLAKHLNAEGVPACRGATHWKRTTIEKMLTNECYVGKRIFGRVSRGKHFVFAGELKANDSFYNTPATQHNERSDWIVVERPTWRLVSDELFEKVRQQMQTNRKRRSPGARFSLEAPLYSILHHAAPHHAEPVRMIKQGSRYRCSALHAHGTYDKETNPGGCLSHSIKGDVLERLVFAKLFSEVSRGGLIDEVEKHVRQLLEERRRGNPDEAERILAEVAKVEARMQRLRKKFVDAFDDETEKLCQDELQRLAERKTKLEADAESAQPAAERYDVDEEARRLSKTLAELPTAYRKWSSTKRRRWLTSVLVRIDVTFEREWVNKRYRHKCSGGTIVFDMDKMATRMSANA